MWLRLIKDVTSDGGLISKWLKVMFELCLVSMDFKYFIENKYKWVSFKMKKCSIQNSQRHRHCNMCKCPHPNEETFMFHMYCQARGVQKIDVIINLSLVHYF